MKAASLIIQFVLFFIIGLGFFLLAGNLFRFQSDYIKGDILSIGSEIYTRQMSSFAINAVNICKSCDNVTLKISQGPLAGASPTYQLSQGIVFEIDSENKIVQSTMHNLFYSIAEGSNKVSSSKTITLTYDRTQNKLVIS